VSSGKIKTNLLQEAFCLPRRASVFGVFDVMRSAGDGDSGGSCRPTERQPESPSLPPSLALVLDEVEVGMASRRLSRAQTSNRCPLNPHQHRVETQILLKMFHSTTLLRLLSKFAHLAEIDQSASLSGELGRLGRSSGSWEERQARLLRRVASQLHAGLGLLGISCGGWA